MRGHSWVNIGGYTNVWQIGPLRTISTVGYGGWNHASVSLEHRCPSWNEMEFVKRSFFEPQECAMQLHVPEAEYLNHHPYCLHLWSPVNDTIPRPPNGLVGVP